ncbi:MAG: hypothetical protein AAB534_01135 [Patescibacteria group bacterium]
MADIVNARDYLERIATPRTAGLVKALLVGIPGNMSLYEGQQDFLRDMLEGFADYRDNFEAALAVTQLAIVISSWR